jgi:hypothetical protein
MRSPSHHHLAIYLPLLVALLSLSPGFALAKPQPSAPPEFPLVTREAFDRALTEKDKPVIVVGLAFHREEWEAWRDPRITQWVSTHAAAFHCGVYSHDADEQIDKLGSLFKGVACFYNGSLVDQDELFSDPESFLKWLNAIERGSVSLDYALSRAGPRTDACSRMSRAILALRLDRLGKTDQADEEFAWLLEHDLVDRAGEAASRRRSAAPDFSDWLAFRRTHPEWETRGRRHLLADAAAQARLAAVRTTLASKADTDPANADVISAWLAIDEVSPDPDRILSWYLALLDNPAKRPLTDKHWEAVFFSLIYHERWADAGRITPRPFVSLIAPARRVWQSVVEYPPLANPGKDREAREMYQAGFAAQGGSIYAALLAAGRKDDARLVSTALFQVVDAPFAYGIVVEIALRAKQITPDLLEWAKIADRDPDGKRLTPEVEAALAAKSKQPD